MYPSNIETPGSEYVVRSYDEQGCQVTTVIRDPDDAQEIVYGTVTRDGKLLGSFYPQDRIRQIGWRVVTVDGRQIDVRYDGEAVMLLVLADKGLGAYDRA